MMRTNIISDISSRYCNNNKKKNKIKKENSEENFIGSVLIPKWRRTLVTNAK